MCLIVVKLAGTLSVLTPHTEFLTGSDNTSGPGP